MKKKRYTNKCLANIMFRANQDTHFFKNFTESDFVIALYMTRPLFMQWIPIDSVGTDKAFRRAAKYLMKIEEISKSTMI